MANAPLDAPIVARGSPSWAVDATPADMIALYEGRLQSYWSRKTAREGLRRIARLFGVDDEASFPWHKLQIRDMQAIRDRLAAHYPPGTANMSLTAMRQVVRAGFFAEVVTAKQLASLEYVDNVRGSRVVRGRELPEEELQKLWATCSSRIAKRAALDRALLAVLLGGGLRRQEVCRVRIPHCAPAELRVFGKGNKERRVPVDSWMRKALHDWYLVRQGLPGIEHDALFVLLGNRCEPMTSWSLWWEVRSLGLEAGLVDAGGRPTFTTHDFRRTFASRLLDRGFDIFEVQRLMGHASSTTTERYDRRSERKMHAHRAAEPLFVPASA